MEAVERTKETLDRLCTSIKDFQNNELQNAVYRAPIIDHFHPDDYRQKTIAGLTRFLGNAQAERDYVAGVLDSGIAPKDFTTNAPNILAIWEEFQRAKRPLVSIAQFLDGRSKGQTKIDVIADGGDEWIKVNTIKEARLLAEFREQDSYINSDYDSDSASSSAESLRRIDNSIVRQAEALVKAARRFQRPAGLPSPRVTLVLTRLDPKQGVGYEDERIPATFEAVRDLGINLVVGSRRDHSTPFAPAPSFPPRNQILLDLSVVIALCCDSTHEILPETTEELESRFRSFKRHDNGSIELEPHVNVTRDLRNQLEGETSHPLIQELDDRLAAAGYAPNDIELWCTREVRDRMPAIVDVIGGPKERARAKALFGESEQSFWCGSRYEGKLRVLQNLRARVMEEGNGETRRPPHTKFEKGMIEVCGRMLSISEGSATPSSSTGSSPSPTPVKGRGSRNPDRKHTVFPGRSQLPSAHTLRTLIKGAESGMTILTNKSGAVGKVIRDMGVADGFPATLISSRNTEVDQPTETTKERAAIWVVNPSSLAEWRRLEVESKNRSIFQTSL